MIYLKNIRLILGSLALITTTLLTSCYREKDSIARITVIDNSSGPVDNAMVRLYPTPVSGGAIVVDDTLYTDASGEALFNYSEIFKPGQTGLLVLDIEVRGPNGEYGEGIIKVREEETNEATVIVN